MARRKNIQPQGYVPKRNIRRKTVRFFILLFGWIGIAMIYYVGFSLFFDTPLEYAMKNSTNTLREQYTELNQRYDSLELVLENLVERDRNVFRLLFESDPYDLDENEPAMWKSREKLLKKSDKELAAELRDRISKLDRKQERLDATFHKIEDNWLMSNTRVNNIPSIQPVINHDLTLLTASYGLRIHPFYKSLASHMGVDYTIPEGSRVFATADGKVTDVARRSTTSGLSITIDHGNGYKTVYNHLGKMNVRVGQQVKRGDIIALSGNTGLSLAPHLHYEVHHNGLRVDPVHYFFMELSPIEYRKLMDIALSGMQSFD